LRRDPAYSAEDLVGRARHLGELRRDLGLRAMRDPRDVELERGERLAELVVDLACDVRALLLAHRLETLRQRARLIVELAAVDRDPGDVRGALDEALRYGIGHARLAVVHGEGTEHMALARANRDRPAGAQA